MVTAICPSRGLIFAKTIQTIWRELRDIQGAELIIVSEKPIPDAQNEAVYKALHTQNELFFFFEEDMQFPKDTLKTMMFLLMQYPAIDGVVVDYPVGNHYSTICHKDDKILWFGFGCTLLRRRVFEQIKDPWFEINKTLKITDLNHMEYQVDNTQAKYGGHDILFGIKCKDAGIKIAEISEIQANQLRLIEFGKEGYNDGFHKIEKLEGINKYQNYFSKKGGKDELSTPRIYAN